MVHFPRFRASAVRCGELGLLLNIPKRERQRLKVPEQGALGFACDNRYRGEFAKVIYGCYVKVPNCASISHVDN